VVPCRWWMTKVAPGTGLPQGAASGLMLLCEVASLRSTRGPKHRQGQEASSCPTQHAARGPLRSGASLGRLRAGLPYPPEADVRQDGEGRRGAGPCWMVGMVVGGTG